MRPTCIVSGHACGLGAMRVLMLWVLLAGLPVDAEVADRSHAAWEAARDAFGSAKQAVGKHVGQAVTAAGSALDDAGVRDRVYGMAGTAAHAAGTAATSTCRLALDSLDRVKPLLAGGLATAGEMMEGTVDHFSSVATDATTRAARSLLNGARSVIWSAVCESNPCQNGGECVISAASDQQYTCLCPASFAGANCERHTGCDSHPCLNGGTCGLTPRASSPSTDFVLSDGAPDADRVAFTGYLCKCPTGFSGSNCDVLGTPLGENSVSSTTGLAALAQYAARCAVLLGLLALGYLVTRGQAAGANAEQVHATAKATPEDQAPSAHTDSGDGVVRKRARGVQLESVVASVDTSEAADREGWVEVGSDETR